MTWYFYLNYRIYKFYQRKREDMPALYSFLGSVLLLYLNVFSILAIVSFFNPLFLLNKLNMLILLIVFAAFNYLVLYRRKYYIEVFDDFDNASDKYKSWNNSVPFYIIGSIILLIVVLLIADYRHDGHL